MTSTALTLAGSSSDDIASDPPQNGTTPDSGPPLEVGDRVLVAGDGRFAWGCGFTQPYGEEVATDWRAALGG